MTRKRFVKLLMSHKIRRNDANIIADLSYKLKLPYEYFFGCFYGTESWDCLIDAVWDGMLEILDSLLR